MVKLKFLCQQVINMTKSLCQQAKTPQMLSVRYCTVRRVLLYVPSNDKRKVDKALSLAVDSIGFDIECMPSDEDEGSRRDSMKKLLDDGYVSSDNPEWCVKVNPIQKGNALQKDIETILTANKLPAGIILSGVDSCEHLQWFSEKMWEKLITRPEDDRGPLKLILVIGSAKGIMRLPEICQKARDLATMAPFIPSALAFNDYGFIESVGGTRSSHGLEFLFARQKLVLVAKAFGLQALDMASSNPSALKEVENECKEGAIMGYTGKQLYHPLFVGYVQNFYSPTRSKIKQARKIIGMCKSHEQEDASFLERIPVDVDALKVANYYINVGILSGKIKNEV